MASPDPAGFSRPRASLGKPSIWAAARRIWESMLAGCQIDVLGRRLPGRVGQRPQQRGDHPGVVGGQALEDRRISIAVHLGRIDEHVGQSLEPGRGDRVGDRPVVATDQHRQGERTLELMALRLQGRCAGARLRPARSVRRAVRGRGARRPAAVPPSGWRRTSWPQPGRPSTAILRRPAKASSSSPRAWAGFVVASSPAIAPSPKGTSAGLAVEAGARLVVDGFEQSPRPGQVGIRHLSGDLQDELRPFVETCGRRGDQPLGLGWVDARKPDGGLSLVAVDRGGVGRRDVRLPSPLEKCDRGREVDDGKHVGELSRPR